MPYTDRGIRRIPCARCGQPSSQQWSVCANGNRYLGVCTACDIDINRLALSFFHGAFSSDDVTTMIADYARRLLPM